jgi:hypothetical protein
MLDTYFFVRIFILTGEVRLGTYEAGTRSRPVGVTHGSIGQRLAHHLDPPAVEETSQKLYLMHCRPNTNRKCTCQLRLGGAL